MHDFATIPFALKTATLSPAPIDPDWIEDGAPRAAGTLLTKSADGATSMILWECTPGKFTWRYSFDETIYFLEGSVVISSENLPSRRFRAGDSIHFPKGAVATWVIEERIRKVAFCRALLPQPFPLIERALRSVRAWLRTRRSGGVVEASILQS